MTNVENSTCKIVLNNDKLFNKNILSFDLDKKQFLIDGKSIESALSGYTETNYYRLLTDTSGSIDNLENITKYNLVQKFVQLYLISTKFADQNSLLDPSYFNSDILNNEVSLTLAIKEEKINNLNGDIDSENLKNKLIQFSEFNFQIYAVKNYKSLKTNIDDYNFNGYNIFLFPEYLFYKHDSNGNLSSIEINESFMNRLLEKINDIIFLVGLDNIIIYSKKFTKPKNGKFEITESKITTDTVQDNFTKIF